MYKCWDWGHQGCAIVAAECNTHMTFMTKILNPMILVKMVMISVGDDDNEHYGANLFYDVDGGGVS